MKEAATSFQTHSSTFDSGTLKCCFVVHGHAVALVVQLRL
jgi:hypothetical protein